MRSRTIILCSLGFGWMAAGCSDPRLPGHRVPRAGGAYPAAARPESPRAFETCNRPGGTGSENGHWINQRMIEIDIEIIPDEQGRWGRGSQWVPHGKYEEGGCAGGLRDGVWLAYHDNGLPRQIGSYRRGRRVGLWTQWSATGRLLGTAVLFGGDGHFVYRRDDGRPAEWGWFSRGLRDGRWRTWEADGGQSVADYEQGALIGRWHYHPTGLLAARCRFDRETGVGGCARLDW